jgi:hypothetical protein
MIVVLAMLASGAFASEPLMAAPVPADTSVCVAVPGGTSGDVAVINITNTQATGRGYGALRASQATPIYNRATANQYSSVNFAANTPPNPNLAFTQIGTDGKICYDTAGSSNNVILDLAATLPTSAVNAQEPTRILDTRPAPGSVTESQVMNQTLPRGTCGGIGERIGLRLRNGTIRSSQPFGGSISVQGNRATGMIVQKDFDGDGLDDAAYLISCWGGGTNVDYEVFIHLAGEAPHRFTEQELYTTSQMTSRGFVNGVSDIVARGSGVDVVWFGSNGSDPNCCPSLKYRTSFQTTPQVQISVVRQLDPDSNEVIGFGDARCSERRMANDVGGEMLIDDQLCESGFAYVDFCDEFGCGFGDSQAILRYVGSRWTVYTYFPNPTLCEATVRADGMPSRIVNRVLWSC